MKSLGETTDNQSELPRLLWVLRNGKGFGLYFVCCNAPAYRRELVDKIKTDYAQPILEFDLSGHDGEEYIDHRLLTWAEDKTPGAPFFLYGLETLLPTRDEDRQFRTLQEINWRRNVYSQLNRNLVIWLPEYALTLLARTASDFYDWHSAVFEFPVPESEKAGFVKQSMMEFMDGETHAANRMTLEEKKRWLSVLNGLLDETPKDSVEHARLLNDLGRLQLSLGEYQDALHNYENSLKIYESVGDQKNIGIALTGISQTYRFRGEADIALRYLEYALEIADKMGNRLGKGVTLNNIGKIYLQQKEYDKALKYFEQALIIRKETNYHAGEAVTLENIGIIYYFLKNYSKSLEYHNSALTISRKVGDRENESASLTNICQVYLALGVYERAQEYIKAALIIQREIGHWAGLGISLIHLGQIYAQQGDQAEAEHAWLEAYRIAKEIGLEESLQALEKLANDLGREGLAYWESQS